MSGSASSMLGLAGVPATDALAATLVYRTVAFWVPLPAGGVAYLLFRRRYSDRAGARRVVRPRT